MPSDPTELPRNFPHFVGVEVLEWEHGSARVRLPLREEHQAGNGYLHAGAVATLADTACAVGCRVSMPEGAGNFTTIEFKINFVGSTQDGAIQCDARLQHGGRTTQVWEATITDERTGKPLAFFTCTQMLLYPR